MYQRLSRANGPAIKEGVGEVRERRRGMYTGTLLYKQHTTVHSATSKTPAWMLLGRELPSPLKRLLQGPDPTTRVTTPHAQGLPVGQTGWIKKFPGGRTWEAGVITLRLGHPAVDDRHQRGIGTTTHGSYSSKGFRIRAE